MCTCLTEFDEETYRKGLLEEGQKLASIENAQNLFALRHLLEHLRVYYRKE